MMIYPPPPPPKPGRTFTRAIFVTLATTIFGLSLAANLYLLMLTGVLSGAASSRSSTLSEGDPKQKIAVVPVSGAIMDDQAKRFERLLTQAEKDPNVKAVVIEVDSPGGSVTASDQIHHRIQRFKADKGANFPVIISMGGLATSGGYYVACAGDHIFAQPTTMTGNIGVLLPRFNLHKLLDKWGIQETTIASTGATYKNAGSMFKPENPVETAYIQAIADHAFSQFKQVVIDGRGNKLKAPIDEVANGKVFMAKEAYDLGLVDDPRGYLKDATDHAATQAKLSNPMVVRYQDPPGIMALFGAESTVPAIQGAGGGVQINGVNVNLDVKQLIDLTTPRLMYLWRGE